MSDADNVIIDLNNDIKDEDDYNIKGPDKNTDADIAISMDDFIDERDEIEWVDVFNLHAFPPNSINQCSRESHRWLGADWTLLIQRNHGSYGLYVGYDVSSHFPTEWYANVSWEFFQVRDDGSETLLHCDQHAFEKVDNGRVDRGSGGIIIDGNDEVKIRVKLRQFASKLSMPIGQRRTYDSKKATDMVGLINNGATCYLNSLLQMLFNINKFRYSVYQLPHDNEILLASTTLALQCVFKNLQYSHKEVSTNELTTAFGWSNQDADIQQDVQEMMRVLLDKLEDKMKGTVVEGAIKSLFAGKFCSYIRCVNVDYESKREEDFYDIQLEVKNCKDIYESFKKYTEYETLDGENQYDAGIHGKQDARKGVDFTSFPPVLTIHLKRFDFDFNTMNFIKINDNYEFPAYLDLDQFLAKDAADDCHNNKYLLHSVLVHAGDVGGGHYYAYIRPSKGYDYASAEDSMLQAHKALKNMPNLNPCNMTIEEAKLKLVSEGAGGKWFKFNDEIVTTVQSKEAIKFCFGSKPISNKKFIGGNSGSAYMLVYIKESMAADIMNESQCEIPSTLLERLEKERMRQELDRKKQERSKMFTYFKFGTEKDVAELKKNVEDQEYVHTENIMKGSSHLYALLKISKRLQISPIKIKLWSCEYKHTVGDYYEKQLSIVNDYTGDFEFYYYVQIVDNNNSSSVIEIESYMNKEAQLVELFRNELQSLGLDENEITEYIYGFGIGAPIKALNIISSDNLRADMAEKLSALTEEMLHVIHAQNDNSEKSIVFLKLFDHQNILPREVWNLSSSKRGFREMDDDEISIEDTLKYLASSTLPYNMSNKSPHDIIVDILSFYRLFVESIVVQLAAKVGIDSNELFTTLYEEFDLYYSFGFKFYPHLIYTKNGEEGLCELGDFKTFHSGAEFVVNLKKMNNRATNKSIERFCQSDNYNSFIRYELCKRPITICPYDNRDKEIVNRSCLGEQNPRSSKKLKFSSDDDKDQGKDQEYTDDKSTFVLELPSYLSMKKSFHTISERLNVPCNRLILLLTNDKRVGVKDFSYPLTYNFVSDTLSIKMVAETMKIPKTFNRFFYIVSPFDIALSQTGSVDLCINVIDDKSRTFRQQSLMSNNSPVDIDPEFIEEKVLFVNVLWHSPVHHSVAALKAAIGLPSDLCDTEAYDGSDDDFLSFNSHLSEVIFHNDEMWNFPKYPLILYKIDQYQNIAIINACNNRDVLRFQDHIPNFACLGGIPYRREKFCIQHVSREDLQFMSSLVPGIESTMVYVYNFTLNGKAVELSDHFGLPFLSYLKNDDTWDSLASRFIEINGDDEISKARLAFIEERIPHFLSRSYSTPESQCPSVWSFIFSIRQKRGPVCLGIQRSASSITSTKKYNGSITIK